MAYEIQFMTNNIENVVYSCKHWTCIEDHFVSGQTELMSSKNISRISTKSGHDGLHTQESKELTPYKISLNKTLTGIIGVHKYWLIEECQWK